MLIVKNLSYKFLKLVKFTLVYFIKSLALSTETYKQC
jgi:hypothetical protein